MLVAEFREALGKTTGALSLYNHSMGCTEVALRVAALAGEGEGPRLDQLLFATFVHDLGKLDPHFQAMLRAVVEGRDLPPKRVKHEASTFDYDHVEKLEASLSEIRDEVKGVLGYEIDLANVDLEMIFAFAVAHHGLFYLSFEWDRTGTLRPLIRRQWTVFYPREERRITLTDLLFEYHPLGGLVIIADLVHSYCHEQGRSYQALLGEVSSVRELIERLIEHSGEIEAGLRRYDPRDYGLRETLRLLTGGM
jgi:hypothetical protein